MMLRIARKIRATTDDALVPRGASDVPAFDLLGQRLHEIRNLLQMRVDGERAAERVERKLLLAELLHDDAEAGERAEVARLARQHLPDVGERSAVVLVGEMEGGTPVPGLDIVGPQLDHGVEQLDRE